MKRAAVIWQVPSCGIGVQLLPQRSGSPIPVGAQLTSVRLKGKGYRRARIDAQYRDCSLLASSFIEVYSYTVMSIIAGPCQLTTQGKSRKISGKWQGWRDPKFSTVRLLRGSSWVASLRPASVQFIYNCAMSVEDNPDV
jgi:hypothetical protein